MSTTFDEAARSVHAAGIRKVIGVYLKNPDDFLRLHGRPRTHFFVDRGRRLPSKAIVAAAMEVPSASFNTKDSDRLLERLGFELDNVPAPLDGSTAVTGTVERTILQRRGQQRFRRALLKAYANKCAVTGSSVVELLEAAHISPFSETQSHKVANGVVLRADIHTLFDLGLAAIEPGAFRLKLATKLRQTEYRIYDGISITLPTDPRARPDAGVLNQRWEWFLDMQKTTRGSAQ